MDKLIQDQHDSIGRMSRTCDNLRKIGKSNITKQHVEQRLLNLDERWREFRARHTEICHTATDEDRKGDYFTQDVFETGEEVHMAQRIELARWFVGDESQHSSVTSDTSLLPNHTTSEAQPNNGTQHHAGPSTINTTPIQVHVSQSALPKANLPTFSGSFDDWIRYRDLFRSLVLHDKSWSDAERFHYLTTSLSGEAAELIQRVPISSRNFKQAWDLLEHRYENKRLLIAAQFDQIYGLKGIRTHTAGELKRIMNCVCNVTAALKSLDVAIDDSAIWMVQYIARLMDEQTLKHWERSMGSRTDSPTMSELLEFLERTIRTLEAVETRTGARLHVSRYPSVKVKSHHTATHLNTNHQKSTCALCQGNHPVYFCQAYKGKPPQERLRWARSTNLCQNCLGHHSPNACRTTKTCQMCAQPHHTSLHEALRGNESLKVTSMITATFPETRKMTTILLATALISVKSQGRARTVRALIDPCSEVTLVSESLVQALQAPRLSCSQVVIGAGAIPTAAVRGRTSLTISPRGQSNIARKVEALILPRLTSYRPQCHHDPHTWSHLAGLDLADPDISNQMPIDILLGADIYPDIILNGIRRGGHRTPVAQNSIFGWILSGPTSQSRSIPTTTFIHTCTTEELTNLVRRFWEQEEVVTSPITLTSEEKACESHFTNTHTRDENGKYIVRLCFSQTPHDLGETHGIARRILLANERRFQGNPQLQVAYRQFMAEYLNLGHMQAVPEEDRIPMRPHFYLPHHGVLKANDSSPKLRVVFNGSKLSSSGTTLNACLSAGPKLQLNLMDVLLRWRRHRIAFVADIEKMYRQIKIHPDDWDYQRILWRDKPEQEIIPYHLTTVTYGLTCAPYLAIRTLHQLAHDEGSKFPGGATVLRESTYVDDILSGADTESEAMQLQENIIGICRAGGFALKKWNANSLSLLSRLPPDSLATSSHIPWHPDLGCSALGLIWHPDLDDMSFSVKPSTCSSTPTKRHVLSQIAQLFDPMGWLAPFIIRGKILMQQLWKEQFDWDEALPLWAEEQWRNLLHDMATLATIRIPRWIGVTKGQNSTQLHVFADASEKAYAAVAYLRIGDSTATSSVSLLVAKSKTAPLKTISLPRLELCAAVLGARILVQVQRELKITINDLHLWSDSTIALAWLRGEPSRWNTYVANRVSEVQRTVPDVHLHHVETQDNPADCASRGITAELLRDHPLWWHGPGWLSGPASLWDTTLPNITTNEEARSLMTTLHVTSPTVPPLLVNYSTLNKLLRVTAWCLRWKKIATKTSQDPLGQSLSPEELRCAESRVILLAQQCDYSRTIAALRNHEPLPKSSRLHAMAPFLDNQGILRVGGRLSHSLLPYDAQHPVIISPDSPVATLIIDHHHRRTLHGGVQLTLASLRHRYWVPQGRRRVKARISQCITCRRWRAETRSQRMGDLPPTRATPSRPFLHTGVDYAGPMHIRTTAGRGHKSTKGYVAIFVCFSTRAVHIEAVTDYSTSAFLAAFRRFTSRRGLCTTLSSDCGTNFVGADQELRRMFTASSKEAAAISNQLLSDGVQWKFIPPGAPHFGGLWEAAVRSTKHHLRRVIGDATLTYEELSTVLCQVEACLNSRPLQALTDDPEDLNPLTPGHFLIGEPMLAIPEPTLLDVPVHRLSRWQQQQQRVEHFWKRWSSEYLHQLQTRRKWTTATPSFTVGELVLIKSELTPPCKWPLARILHVHPGADGLVRVVTVKTATTVLKRPITKIVPLERESEN